jgi:hypothetical protein
MISGPYHIQVIHTADGWFVLENMPGHSTGYGPYRWWWQAALVLWIKDMR